MKYTVALIGDICEEHHYENVDLLQVSDTSEDYILWDEKHNILAVYPRKEVRYIINTDE